MLKSKLKQYFNRHFEWGALAAGLIIMAMMNPYIPQGHTWCLFEWAGIPFCPGHGLGHSVSFIFRGDWHNAMQANIMGPFAIVILIGRIGALLKQNYINPKDKKYYHDAND